MQDISESLQTYLSSFLSETTLYLSIAVLVFLFVFRELICWYFKISSINKRLANIESLLSEYDERLGNLEEDIYEEVGDDPTDVNF